MEKLVKEYQLRKNGIIFQKIVEQSQDLINYFVNNNNTNIPKEDLYDYVLEGLMYAVKYYRYNQKSFFSYADTCIRRILNSKLKSANNNQNLFKSFLEIKAIFENKYGTTLEKDYSLLDDILDYMNEKGLLYSKHYYEARKEIVDMLKDYYGTLRTKENENSEYTDIPFELPIDISNLKDLLKLLLGEKDFSILAYYYGAFGYPKLTQKEIASMYNLSQVSIHKKNKNSLQIIREYFENENLYIKRSTI